MTDTATPRTAEIERLRAMLQAVDNVRDEMREMVAELAIKRGIFSEVMGDDPDLAPMREPANPPQPLPPIVPAADSPPVVLRPVFSQPRKRQ